MMSKRVAFIVALMVGLVTVLVLTSQAHAVVGNLQFHCPPNKDPLDPTKYIFRQQDPMLHYGQASTGHLHQGSRNFNSTTTMTDLMDTAGGCIIKSNRSLFLWPVPLAPAGTAVPAGGMTQTDGKVVVPAVNFRYYFRQIGTNVVAFPLNGFKQLIGNPENTGDYGSLGRWQCLNGSLTSPPLLWMPNENSHGTYNGKAWSCAAPAALEETIRDGNTCWDGVRSGPGMGTTDGPANGLSHKQPCDAAHPYRLAVIDAVLDFPHAALAVGTRLSSDNIIGRPGLSAHIDDIEFFPLADTQTRLLGYCMNQTSPPLPDNYPPMDPNGLSCQEEDSPAGGQPAGTGTIWVTTRNVPLGQAGPNKSIPAVTH